MELRVGKEIEHIREMIIRMATLTEESVTNAINAFLKPDFELAQAVVEHDHEINSMEMDIDKEVFECLALKAPVASDLRFLFSIQKINKDLERIGDHAVNIAQAAINSDKIPHQVSTVGSDIQIMASITRSMLSDAINSFTKADIKLAEKVLRNDDQVDDLNRAMSREIVAMIKVNVEHVESALELLKVSRNLERIADLSTNISEDVIFHANAKDVKHHHRI